MIGLAGKEGRLLFVDKKKQKNFVRLRGDQRSEPGGGIASSQSLPRFAGEGA
jgi:hypothetical protein